MSDEWVVDICRNSNETYFAVVFNPEADVARMTRYDRDTREEAEADAMWLIRQLAKEQEA